MKTSFVETKTISAGYGTTPGDVYYSVPFESNSTDGSIAHSQLYRTYTTLYEEVKIVGVKVAVAVVTPVGDTTTPSLQIYTAWDRKRCYSEAAPTATQIIQASTYNVATALNNNVAKISRSCYASDLMEKAQWIDATTGGTGYANLAFMACEQHCPCFSPSFMFTCLSPSLGAAHNVTISISYTYYMAFRNPKFGGGSAKSVVTDLGERVATKGAPADGDDGDMDCDANLEWNPDLDSYPGDDVSSGLSDLHQARRITESAAEASADPYYRQAVTEVLDETTRDVGFRHQQQRAKAKRKDMNEARRKQKA